MHEEIYLERAIQLSYRIHGGQTRKGTTVPYITHPLAVMDLIFQYGGRVEQAIAGVLHDSIEDHPDKTSLQYINSQFPDFVTHLVSQCTEDKSVTNWKTRKQDFIHKVYGMDGNPQSEKLVIACDKLHNLQSLYRNLRLSGDCFWKNFNAPKEDIIWYYEEIIKALDSNWVGHTIHGVEHEQHPIISELDISIRKLKLEF